MGISQIVLVALGAEQGGGFGIGWQSFFILHGVTSTVFITLGALLLRNPPEGWHPENWQPGQMQNSVKVDAEWKEMLNTPLACMLWITFIFGATSGLMAIARSSSVRASRRSSGVSPVIARSTPSRLSVR